jgi:hypothetical protein
MKAIHRVMQKPSLRGWRSALTAAVVAGVWSNNANAMPTFPGEIQKHLQMSETPPCTLCHATLSGGGPVVTRFGQAMIKYGLDPSSDASVGTALDNLEQRRIDSNGDRAPDVEQLRAGVDPNTGQPLAGAEKFGCGARVATGSTRANAGFILATVLACMALRIRRRERPRPLPESSANLTR